MKKRGFLDGWGGRGRKDFGNARVRVPLRPVLRLRYAPSPGTRPDWGDAAKRVWALGGVGVWAGATPVFGSAVRPNEAGVAPAHPPSPIPLDRAVFQERHGRGERAVPGTVAVDDEVTRATLRSSFGATPRPSRSTARVRTSLFGVR
jgi:hypothetical protein